MGSSDVVNYAIRPNKAVERQVVFDVLESMEIVLPLATYRYVGFGAPWFVDFALAHRRLGIQDMVSLERDGVAASRARFNRPYAGVKIIEGDSSSVLPTMGLEGRATLAWLDYDTGLDGPVLADLAVLCERAMRGSVIVVTLNADRNRVPTSDSNGEEFPDWTTRIHSVAGDLVPLELRPQDTTRKGYCVLVASMLFQHMHRQVRRAGRDSDCIAPILDIRYSDGAPMITVGGVLCAKDRAPAVKEAVGRHEFGGAAGGKEQMEIQVPPLTLKEKATLDQLLPSEEVPTESDVAQLGFRLRRNQIAAYRRFYRHYPTFAELAL